MVYRPTRLRGRRWRVRAAADHADANRIRIPRLLWLIASSLIALTFLPASFRIFGHSSLGSGRASQSHACSHRGMAHCILGLSKSERIPSLTFGTTRNSCRRGHQRRSPLLGPWIGVPSARQLDVLFRV